MIKQTVARRSLTKGAAQARRLNAQRTIAPSVIAATTQLVADQAARGPVQSRRAAVAFGRGGLIIRQGEAFFLVESAKFAGRFYFLVERDGRWLSSSDDARVTAQLAATVKEASKKAVLAEQKRAAFEAAKKEVKAIELKYARKNRAA